MELNEKVPINGYLSRYFMNHMDHKAMVMDRLIAVAKSLANAGEGEEQVDEIKTSLLMRLLRSQVNLVKEQYGYCLTCVTNFGRIDGNGIQPIYQVRYHYDDDEGIKTTSGRCKKHISSFFWQEVVSLAPLDFSLFDVEKDFPEPSFELENCASCTQPMHPVDDVYNYRRAYFTDYRVVEAEDNNGVMQRVHADCTFTCNFHLNEDYEPEAKRFVSRHTFSKVPGVPHDTIDGKTCCIECVEKLRKDNELVVCDRCSDWTVEQVLSHCDIYNIVCTPCYNAEWSCENCEEWFGEDDDHDCSYDSDNSSDTIHSYSYKPHPVFHGNSSKNLFFGLELEMESFGGNWSEGIDLLADRMQDSGRAYLKTDGSLRNGVELVTHPHTLEEFQRINWSFLDELKKLGWRSWDTETCGIHVHVSRKSFDAATLNQRETHQIKFIKLIYDNEKHVQRIAGRKSSWAKFNDKGKVVRKVKYGYQSEGRYSAVNVEPTQTLEVRVFRGSLRKERILSAIEFVHAAVEYTRDLPVVYTEDPFSWTAFMGYVLSNRKTYPNLTTIIDELMASSRQSSNNSEEDND